MKILLICTANRDRSKTAEIHFAKKYPQHEFQSAGINKYLCERKDISRSNIQKGQHVKQYMLKWADRIICMEHIHAEHIASKIDKKYLSKIEVLELGDTEGFMSDSLIKMLEEKFKI